MCFMPEQNTEIDIHFVREKVITKGLDVRYVPTKEQPADLLTKPLTTTTFELFLKLSISFSKLCYQFS